MLTEKIKSSNFQTFASFQLINLRYLIKESCTQYYICGSQAASRRINYSMVKYYIPPTETEWNMKYILKVYQFLPYFLAKVNIETAVNSTPQRAHIVISYAPLLSHKFKPSGPINGLFVHGPLTTFVGLSYVRVSGRQSSIFSQRGCNIHIVDRYWVAGRVLYRDSKCNIGLHKIGVKLFGRLLDLSSAVALVGVRFYLKGVT